jgi:hypothetical protein
MVHTSTLAPEMNKQTVEMVVSHSYREGRTTLQTIFVLKIRNQQFIIRLKHAELQLQRGMAGLACGAVKFQR